MKTWGCAVQYRGDSTRMVVTAKTIKRAVELLNKVAQHPVSLYHFRLFAAKTGNEKELSMAAGKEGVILQLDFNKYKRLF